MRLDKRRLTTALGNYLVNPLVKLAVALGAARRATRSSRAPGASRASRAAAAIC